MFPPAEHPYRVSILQRSQHEAAIAQVLRQGLVVETFVVLLVTQGEGLRQHIHLSSDVGLESVCLASLAPALTPLAYGLQQLGTNKVHHYYFAQRDTALRCHLTGCRTQQGGREGRRRYWV